MNNLAFVGAVCSALLVAMLNGSPARACSCAEMPPPAEAIDGADAVFTGRVVEVRVIKEWKDISGGQRLEGGGFTFESEEIGYTPVLYTRFDVLGVWKGVDRKSVWVRSGYFNPACGYKFKVGGRYLVYGYWSEEHRVLATGYCTRTSPISMKEAPEDLDVLPEPSYEMAKKHRESVAAELKAGASTIIEGEIP